jgi:PAS domain S-box-containing protein
MLTPKSPLNEAALLEVLERAAATEARFRTIVERSHEGIWQTGTDGLTTYVNARVCDMLGYASHELIGKSPADFIPEGSQEAFRENAASRARGISSRYDIELVRKDGSRVWVMLSAAPLYDHHGAFEGSVAVLTDMTARKSEEFALRESEYRHRIAVEHSTVGMIYLGTDGTLTWVNPAYAKMIGYEVEELVGQSVARFTHPEDLKVSRDTRQDAVDGQYGECLFDKRYIKKDGTVLWASISSRLIKGEDGKPSHFASVVLDITRRKLAEEALRESEIQLRRVMEAGNVGIWIHDLKSGQSTWSDQLKRMKGYPLDCKADFGEFVSRVHPEDRPFFLGAPPRNNGTLRVEFRFNCPDGRQAWFQSVVTWVHNELGELERVFGHTIDITDRKEAERVIDEQRAKMVLSAKMSALGEMASGIAHEINNPLSIIHGKASQLKDLAIEGTLDAAHVAKVAEKIESTALRISKIVKAMRALARDGEKEPFESASLKTLLDDTIELCQEKFKHHAVTLCVPEVEAALRLHCRGVQICQVMLNLIVNAHDAVERLEIKWVRLDILDRGESIDISVTDSGSGIPPELREKILQPFFTTKEAGKGTGLGLSLSRGIVESHGGTLKLDTDCPNTRFVVSLPKLPAAISAKAS